MAPATKSHLNMRGETEQNVSVLELTWFFTFFRTAAKVTVV